MRKRRVAKELSIQPREEGVSYELDSMYLSNEKKGEPHPVPFEIYGFIARVRAKPYRRTHFVHIFSGATEKEAIEELRKFASRRDVQLVDEKTRERIPKSWFSNRSTQEISGQGPGSPTPEERDK